MAPRLSIMCPAEKGPTASQYCMEMKRCPGGKRQGLLPVGSSPGWMLRTCLTARHNTHTHSPFKVKVLPTHDASKVKASGPGLNTTGVPASLPVEFTIDAKDAGEGLLAVQITVSSRNKQGRQGGLGLGGWSVGCGGQCLISLGSCTKEGREGQGPCLWFAKVVTTLG